MNIKKILIWTGVTAAIAAGAAFGVWHIFMRAEYNGATTSLYIPAGATTDAVRDSLEAFGGFGNKVYRLWSLQNGTPERSHGHYIINDGDRAIDVARRIATGRQTPLRVTFNNLRTFGQLESFLGRRLEADSAAFAECADTLLAARGFAREEFAAAVLPDTYEFYWTASPARVLSVLENTRSNFWTPERRAKAEALGLTPAQVSTVASIVEEETNKAEERGKVARLYLNRLQRNMPLQADPTVKFALGDFGLRRITGSHLAVQSPYNTYINPGLPPGPIRIVEASTIDAVLNATEHNYLYMCAKPDFSGYHDFTTTYDRHRINAARYHRALSARGL